MEAVTNGDDLGAREGVDGVTSAYYEETGIPGILLEVRRAMDGLGRPSEMAVVEDRSTDQTVSLAAGEGARVLTIPRSKWGVLPAIPVAE